MERPVQRQRPCGGHEGLISNLSKTPFTKPNMASNWLVHRAVPSSQTERLEEAPRQTSLQARDSWDGIKVSMGPCPERPGVPDCVHYSRTGICGLGMNCHFNHPPNLKQVPQVEVELPERIGQLECQFYSKTGTCKFGVMCKYKHSDDKTESGGQAQFNFLGLPMRQGEKECPYYMRTGSCKYGVTCKFHHPEPAAEGTSVPMSDSPLYTSAGSPLTSSPAGGYSRGLPSWTSRAPYIPGAHLQESPGYLHSMYPQPQGMPSMTGWSSNYQAPVSSLSSSEPKQYTLGMDIVNNSARPDDLDLSGFRAVPAISGSVSSAGMELPAVEIPPIVAQREAFPERPGQLECQHYLKTGDCKFGAACRYDHPKERFEQSSNHMHGHMGLPLQPGRVSPLLASKEKQYPMGRDLVNTSTQSNDLVVSGVRSVLNTSEAVSYSGMGSPAVQSQPLVKQRGPFPERPGQPECQYFLKTGDCKYGVACRFHHPKEKSEQPSTWMLSQMGLPFRPGFVSPSSLVEKQTPIERSFVNSSKQQNDLAVVATSEPVSSATMGLPGVQTQAIATQVGAFPERPGQSECQHYLKTGDCKFGAACKYHHPKERIEQSSPCMLSQLGLPVRPGQPTCTFYSRFGICKFGPMCKFDHPLSGINSDPSAPLNSVYARGSSVTNMRGRSPSETSQKFERSTLKS